MDENGIGVISETRGGINMDESDDEIDSQDDGYGNDNQGGRNGDELGNASGNGNYDLNNDLNNKNSQFGMGSMGSMDLGLDNSNMYGLQNVNSVIVGIVVMV